MYVRNFFKAWFSDWLALMSGAPTVPLAVLALYVSSTPFRILYGSLAVACAVLTSYRIWLKERKALEGEQDKNQFPRIDAKFTRIQIVPRLGTVPLGAAINQQAFVSDYDIFAEVFLVNQSQVACTIQRYEGTAQVNGHDLKIGQEAELGRHDLVFDLPNGSVRRDEMLFLPASLDRVALQRGIGYRGWLRFELAGLRNTDKDQVQFGLTIVDSFDRKHSVTKQELDSTGRVEERPGPRIRVLG